MRLNIRFFPCRLRWCIIAKNHLKQTFSLTILFHRSVLVLKILCASHALSTGLESGDDTFWFKNLNQRTFRQDRENLDNESDFRSSTRSKNPLPRYNCYKSAKLKRCRKTNESSHPWEAVFIASIRLSLNHSRELAIKVMMIKTVSWYGSVFTETILLKTILKYPNSQTLSCVVKITKFA